MGRGSEFVFALPLSSSTAEETDGEVARPKARRILVVEDNPDSAETLRDALQLRGHAVTVARTDPEGLEVARAGLFDVILCDIGLPGLDGYGVARSIRAEPNAALQKTLLIAVSGYAAPEDIEKAKLAGFDRHVAKPPNLDALEALFR